MTDENPITKSEADSIVQSPDLGDANNACPFELKRRIDMARRRRRGRPLTYKFARRKQLAGLIRLHGVSGTREILQRSMCNSTLLKIAKEFECELKKGRRPREAA